MEQFKKFKHAQLQDIIDHLSLNSNLKETLKTDATETGVLRELTLQSLFDVAIEYLSFGLPTRQAVWWAYLSAYEKEADMSNQINTNALRLCETWVKSMPEGLESQAKSQAEALDLNTAASWTNMAIYFNSENIAPKGQAHVKPAPFMTGRAIYNAHMIASHGTDRDSILKLYLKRGLHIAMGGNGKIDFMD